MHLVLGRHRFDVTHRAVVVGLIGDDERSVLLPGSADDLLDQGADVLATTTADGAVGIRARTDVPVVIARPGAVVVDDGSCLDAVGPFAGVHPDEALGHYAVAAIDGARVLVTTDVTRVRRTADVVARLLEAREPS